MQMKVILRNCASSDPFCSCTHRPLHLAGLSLDVCVANVGSWLHVSSHRASLRLISRPCPSDHVSIHSTSSASSSFSMSTLSSPSTLLLHGTKPEHFVFHIICRTATKMYQYLKVDKEWQDKPSASEHALHQLHQQLYNQGVACGAAKSWPWLPSSSLQQLGPHVDAPGQTSDQRTQCGSCIADAQHSRVVVNMLGWSRPVAAADLGLRRPVRKLQRDLTRAAHGLARSRLLDSIPRTQFGVLDRRVLQHPTDAWLPFFVAPTSSDLVVEPNFFIAGLRFYLLAAATPPQDCCTCSRGCFGCWQS